MLSLSHWSKLCFAATTLACLSTITLTSQTALQHAETNHQDPVLHRGSGRAIAPIRQFIELAQDDDVVATDGRNELGQLAALHRGSGRSPQDLQSTSISYRGSGRVVPHASQPWEWV